MLFYYLFIAFIFLLRSFLVVLNKYPDSLQDVHEYKTASANTRRNYSYPCGI